MKIKIEGEVWDWTNYVVQQELERAGDYDKIEVEINSVGGSVFAGTAIYDSLTRRKAPKTGYGYGVIASIASVIAQALDEFEMADTAFMMIHQASALSYGTAETVQSTADMLERIDDVILKVYVDAMERRGKMGDDRAKAERKVRKLMEAETWLTAQEAVDLGLADKVRSNSTAPPPINASTQSARFVAQFRNVPKQLLEQTNANAKPQDQPKPQDEPLLNPQKPNNVEKNEKIGIMQKFAAMLGFTATPKNSGLEIAEAANDPAPNTDPAPPAPVKDQSDIEQLRKEIEQLRNDLATAKASLSDANAKRLEAEKEAERVKAGTAASAPQANQEPKKNLLGLRFPSAVVEELKKKIN